MEQIKDIASYITTSLKYIFNGDHTDIPKIKLYYHYVESILISLFNAKRLNLLDEDYFETLKKMAELDLLSENIPHFYQKYKTILQDMTLIRDLLKRSDEHIIHKIHESLLSQDLNISDNDIWFSTDKVSRDTTGSYYTPNDLALEVIREAISKYLKTNDISCKKEATVLLSNTTFADLSCGCGEFIKVLTSELIEQYGIDPDKVYLNIYGIDIDPIALQITICDLLEVASGQNWNEIISHFVLGNPLINQPNEKDQTIKTSLFALGRYYSPDMGIDIHQLMSNAHIDIIIGNPPWEKVRFEERKFFKSVAPKISAISQKNKRQSEIKKLKDQSPLCYEWYRQIVDDYTKFKYEAKKHPLLHKSLRGELNTYALFTELTLNIIDSRGTMSLLVKSAIATSPANKLIFSHITKQKNLASICLFNNTLRIFDIDSRELFCVITCTKKTNLTFELLAGATKSEDIHKKTRLFFSEEDINTINPYTGMLPNISNIEDIQILLTAHRRLPLFDMVYPECHYGRLVHLTAHSEHIDTVSTEQNVPIYEGKFIERFDARFSTFADMPKSKKYSAKAHAKKIISTNHIKPLPESRYFIQKDFWEKISANYTHDYMLCWRSLTSPTNSRTTLAMILPFMPTSQSIQFLQTNDVSDLLIMLALLNSKAFDFLVRLKMPGIDLTQSVIKQIPVPSRESYNQYVSYLNVEEKLERHIIDRILVMLSFEPLLSSICKGYGPPPDNIQNKTRSTIEKELDDLLFMAYGFSASEIKEIKSTFKK